MKFSRSPSKERLERSVRRHRFALVIVDYATRYPEAVALRTISAKSVADALFRLISRVGIPKEILTDQGTVFMSRTLRELYELLGIKSIRTSVYHPQTDGLVKRLNRTLKTMIRKFVHYDAKNWDKWLEPLLFAVREVLQASTGFSPFELLYGRQPRGVLDVLKEIWEEGPSESRNEIQYVLDLRTKLHTLGLALNGEFVTSLGQTGWCEPDSFSASNRRHMEHVRTVLRALRLAGLTASPKCAVGRVEVRYLGFHLGHGQVRPQIDKTAAVATCPRPKIKKETDTSDRELGAVLSQEIEGEERPVLYISCKLQ
ncbi:hypothetical protein PO909_025992 [Leuciscus waleckii]